MRPNFCIFTDVHGREIAVNPQHVRCVQPHSADSTRIEFDDTPHVTVRIGVVDVVHGLRTSQD